MFHNKSQEKNGLRQPQKNQLADRINKIRKKNNQKQADFAKALGVTKSHISKIETGVKTPSEQLLRSICREYLINDRWLKEGKGPVQPEALKGIKSKSDIITYVFLAHKAKQYDKILDCLGRDIMLFEDNKVQPGHAVVVNILEHILDDLKNKKSEEFPEWELQSEKPEIVNDTEKSVLNILRTIDNNSFKDFCLFLSSKAVRLKKKDRAKLEREIKLLKKASR